MNTIFIGLTNWLIDYETYGREIVYVGHSLDKAKEITSDTIEVWENEKVVKVYEKCFGEWIIR